MKKILIMAAVVALVTSCNRENKAKEMLAKKWQISEYKDDVFEDQLAKLKNAADTTKDSTMRSHIVSNLKLMDANLQEFKKSTVEYKTDGSFEANIISVTGPQNMKGSWLILDNGKRLVTTDSNQKSDTLSIDELTEDRLVSSVTSKGKKASVIFILAK